MPPLLFTDAFDLAGTFVFALSGAMLAVRRQLDIFGVLVLAAAVGIAGGILRDVLLGDTPPAAIRDTRYILAALAGGVVVFFVHPLIERLGKPVMVLDAAGLGLFAITGCAKALTYDLTPLAAMLIGVLSAVGGGALRDILVAEVPRVLREDVYALAALLGAGLFAIGVELGGNELALALAGIALTVVVRVVSVQRGWHAPRARGS
ncbi:trimeric intracellular cation channel family protein [Pseudooceanicola sp. LIPI14-2-Ac024]|uniref:trimeric intracellular cation channel family protein n=1 Tax=Pseudooceanicola sp. LIPI14-2-Ac024 TaxID=3344875 RepID=UPI0035CE8CE0